MNGQPQPADGPAPDLKGAAHDLATARREGRSIERLPEACRPASNEDALLVQQGVAELLDDTVAGWKVGLPKDDDLLLAPLLSSTISLDGSAAVVPYGGKARIEPEVAFVIGEDLPPRGSPYGEDEIRARIGETRLVLELIAARYTDPTALPWPEVLADSFNNLGLLVGPVLADPFTRELGSFQIVIEGPDGPLLTHEGQHPNGHPLPGLVWLVNFLSSRGQTLPAGQVVTTGSYAGVLEVPLSTPLTIRFGELGALEARLLSRKA